MDISDNELKFCPACHNEHKRISRKKSAQLRPWQKFYFTEYDYCFKCGHIQHYTRFKVFVGSEPAKPILSAKKAAYLPSTIISSKDYIGSEPIDDIPWHINT